MQQRKLGTINFIIILNKKLFSSVLKVMITIDVIGNF